MLLLLIWVGTNCAVEHIELDPQTRSVNDSGNSSAKTASFKEAPLLDAGQSVENLHREKRGEDALSLDRSDKEYGIVEREKSEKEEGEQKKKNQKDEDDEKE